MVKHTTLVKIIPLYPAMGTFLIKQGRETKKRDKHTAEIVQREWCFLEYAVLFAARSKQVLHGMLYCTWALCIPSIRCADNSLTAVGKKGRRYLSVTKHRWGLGPSVLEEVRQVLQHGWRLTSYISVLSPTSYWIQVAALETRAWQCKDHSGSTKAKHLVIFSPYNQNNLSRSRHYL